MFVCASIAQAVETGGISGDVFDQETKEVLPGVGVILEGTEYGTKTNALGHFEIDDIPVGVYTINISLIGYRGTKIGDIKIIADSVSSLKIGLVVLSIGSDEVVVEAEAPKIEKTITASRLMGDSKHDYSDYNGITKPSEPSKLPTRHERPSTSGLKAGYADDNKQYNYFLNFLDSYGNQVAHKILDIGERICLKIEDQNGKALPNADIAVYANDRILMSGKTYADGSFLLFPSLYQNDATEYKIKYTCGQISGEEVIDRDGNRNCVIPLQLNRGEFDEAAVDILFILDTTGSMGEEINQLKATLEIIHYNLISIIPKVNIRFGLVLYRDKRDNYVTRSVPLTTDVDSFLQELNKVGADGGGDRPEDLQAALDEAIHNISWNPEAIRLGFIITDAPPHLDYAQEYTYADAAKDANQQGIKLFSVGTGGLDIAGEYVLRQISQLTYAKYIFLTYGERGESDGGSVGSVSHHTGDNYITDKLEAIIIQFAREELSNLMDIPQAVDEEYFTATKIETEKNDETLTKLFDNALSQLIDYSCIKLPNKTILGVMPITANDTSGNSASRYFTESLVVAADQSKTFTLADRTALEKIAEEWKLQLSGAVSDTLTAKIGELLGAQVLLVGNLFDKNDNYELFLKLVRVETGELLAATKLKIDHRLGLS